MRENIIEIRSIDMLEKQIATDTLTAMKNSDKFKVSVLRMLKSALQIEKINSKSTDLTDEQVIMVLKKQIKERTASIEEYTKYNRLDLVSDLEKEIAILEIYLPKQLSHEELETKVQEILKNYPNATIKDMGKIMKEASSTLGSVADMSEVSKLIKASLN